MASEDAGWGACFEVIASAALVACALLTPLLVHRADAAPPELPGAAYQTSATTDCSAAYPGKARITFTWWAAVDGPHFIDLTLQNNNFAPGTFVYAGPIDGWSRSFTWDGIEPGLLHYFRVNTLAPWGWDPSPVNAIWSANCAAYAAPPPAPMPAAPDISSELGYCIGWLLDYSSIGQWDCRDIYYGDYGDLSWCIGYLAGITYSGSFHCSNIYYGSYDDLSRCIGYMMGKTYSGESSCRALYYAR